MLGVETHTTQVKEEQQKQEGMKSIRGRIIKKLKYITISSLTSLNPSFLFQHLERSSAIPIPIPFPKECDKKIIGSPEQEIFKDVLQEGELVVTTDNNSSHGNGNGNGNGQTELEEDLQLLLREFEEKCPPGGNESVVFYTTSFRGIRKTFEDCSSVRFLLDSFKIVYEERDISMDLQYREELWKVLDRKVVPPRLFIRGRHIGGADEVVGLHEQGLLKKLLQGIPLIQSNHPCSGCAGVRFVLCLNCNGSRKIILEARSSKSAVRCLDCNENGLVKCPVCSLKF